jgi:hypothetical protein
MAVITFETMAQLRRPSQAFLLPVTQCLVIDHSTRSRVSASRIVGASAFYNALNGRFQ